MPSPFSCFSPSYVETLPRNGGNKQRKTLSDLNYSNDDEFGRASTSPSLGHVTNKPIRFEDYGNNNRKSVEMNRTGLQQSQVTKRKSTSSNKNKRISKDLIGLPYNFIHEGHLGKDSLDLNSAKDLQSTLDSLNQALSSSSSSATSSSNNAKRHQSTPAFPSSYINLQPNSSLPNLSKDARNSLPVPPPPPPSNSNSKPLPHPSHSNSTSSPPPISIINNNQFTSNSNYSTKFSTGENRPSSQFSPSLPLSRRRKPAPPVTPSIIKQAGSEAVLNSASILPVPSLPFSSSNYDPNSTFNELYAHKSQIEEQQEKVLNQGVGKGKGKGIEVEIEEPTSKALAQELGILPTTSNKLMGEGNHRIVGPQGAQGGGAGYMTETTKGKWNLEMRAIEEALRF